MSEQMLSHEKDQLIDRLIEEKERAVKLLEAICPFIKVGDPIDQSVARFIAAQYRYMQDHV